MDLFQFDKQYLSDETSLLAGADEVGRGPWAGAVVAAIVIFPSKFDPQKYPEFASLNDSKKITEKSRNKLTKIIKDTALVYSISFVDEKTIDEINILEATKLAIQNCLIEIEKSTTKPNILLIDGNYKITSNINQKSIIKGDSKSAAIAAASILAKVARDEYMQEMDKKYPEYKFSSHKGYGTKLHRELLLKHGPSPIHRKTFRPVSDFFDNQLSFI